MSTATGSGVLLDAFSPGSRQRWRGHGLGDPACYRRQARPRAPRPPTSRTQHSCGLWRPRPAGRGGCAGGSAPAGPDTYRCPGPWPFEVRLARPAGGRPVRQGSRLGRVVVGVFLLAGFRSGGGRGCAGLVLAHQARSSLVTRLWPRSRWRPPTHRRAVARWATAVSRKRARPASHQTVGLPGLRPRTPATGSRSTDRGVSSLWLAPRAPVRPRLAGRPVAQDRTKRWTSKTCLVRSMW
jgi:hypothetical protein